MNKYMLLSIFWHRPSARVAPQHCPILLDDNYNSILLTVQVKHFHRLTLDLYFGILQPSRYYSSKYVQFL